MGTELTPQPPEASLDVSKRIEVANWPTPWAVIELWPGGVAPGLINADLTEVTVEEGTPGQFHYRAVHGVVRPRLCFFPAAKPGCPALIITPGGSYRRIAFDIEGYELARYFTARGFNVFVLIYRLPAEGWANAADAPLTDAQRAVRVVRSKAASLGVDPKRLGFMGFSAGGHICASLATRFDAKVYDPVDEADGLSARPDLCAPIYPVISTDPALAHMQSRQNLLGDHPTDDQLKTYSPDRMVTATTPPCFLTHAEDDPAVPPGNTLAFHDALRAAHVTTEMHLFPTGGHGFGLRKVEGTPTHAWADLFTAFARAQDLL